MHTIYETENFEVSAAKRPHVDRMDGGHVKITPKLRVCDRTVLSPDLARELMLLTQVVGKTMITVLNDHGVDVGRINYQENGNWGVFREEGPYLHIHLYGRAKSAVIQTYGDALYFPQRETGFYDNLTPLEPRDIAAMRNEIVRLSTS
jgi:diadenosine tetraphosphate (Ap4A) HIT family hydrolase